MSTGVQRTLPAEGLLESEKYIIRNGQKKFYKEKFEFLRTGNSVEKKSTLINFVLFFSKLKLYDQEEDYNLAIYIEKKNNHSFCLDSPVDSADHMSGS